MLPLPAVPSRLRVLLDRQDGAVTVEQAYSAGLTRAQVRTLVRNGWTNQVRGVLIEPEPPKAFRASVRAALLGRPGAVACGITAARLHKLCGLPCWTPSEVPHVALRAGLAPEDLMQHPEEIVEQVGLALNAGTATKPAA